MLYNGLFSTLSPFSFSIILPRRSRENMHSWEIGFETWSLNRVARGLSHGLSASDSICVRSRRIQGVSIVRKRWRYHRRNLRKNSFETRTRYDWGTKMLEKKYKRKLGVWLGRREEMDRRTFERWRTFFAVAITENRGKDFARIHADRLNSYMACHKRNGCPVDGKAEARSRSNNGYKRFTAVSANEGLVLII